MDLTFTDEQNLLRQTVRELCEKFSPPESVRELEDDPVGFRPELWRELSSLGLTGLTIAEEFGGAGAGALDLVILYEEFGRALVPSPHFISAVVAAGALRAAGATDLLLAIAEGQIVTVAWVEPGGSETPDGITTKAVRDGDRWLLTGAKLLVPFARAAAALLVLARTDDGVTLFLADPTGVDFAQELTMASDTSWSVQFNATPATLVGESGCGWDAWEEALTDALIAIAAYCNGGAERAHEMAVAYAKERVQFDRPIGSFQGVAHPLADTATEIAGSRVLTYQASWARARGRNADTLAAMAKMYAADVFRRTTKVGQQVLGGIGFTRDIDMQLYFRRAKQLEITWLGPRALEERIAAAELDADVPFVSIDAGAAHGN